MKNRNVNRNKIIKSLHSNLNWRDQFKFVEIDHNIKPSWFGLPFMLNENLIDKKEKILKFLSSKGIENRPILSGNFLNQPAAKTYNLNKANLNFKNADEVEKRGFFIGLHTTRISKKDLDFLTLNLLKIDKI
jgi:CDP-6-deoxy-D-xylo-4-hexulose-3-dehydrase